MTASPNAPPVSPTGRPAEPDEASPWRDAQLGTWFDATQPSPTVEIVLENLAARSWFRSLALTLTSRYGTQQCRFVAREDDAVLGPVDHAVSGSFPVLALQLPDARLHAEDAWGDEATDRLQELEQRLRQDGWQLTGQGEHWWSKIFTRAPGAPSPGTTSSTCGNDAGDANPQSWGTSAGGRARCSAITLESKVRAGRLWPSP